MSRLLSVIIPVYNVQEYLHKCVKSVLRQTYEYLDIILVDDGSTDRSGEICDQYQSLDRRVTVIHKLNGGLSSARNAGLEQAKGSLIAFLDSDDWIEPDMYERLTSAMEAHDADVASCKSQNADETGTVEVGAFTGGTYLFDAENAIRGLLTQGKIRFEVWNKVFTRDIVGETRFKQGQVCEDIYFMGRILMRIKLLVYLDVPLHCYLTKREGNTNSTFKTAKIDAIGEFRSLADQLRAAGMQEAAGCIQAAAVQFAIGLYLHAQKLGADVEVRAKIKKEYTDLKRAARGNRYLNRKSMLLFEISPALYNLVLEGRNKK